MDHAVAAQNSWEVRGCVLEIEYKVCVAGLRVANGVLERLLLDITNLKMRGPLLNESNDVRPMLRSPRLCILELFKFLRIQARHALV